MDDKMIPLTEERKTQTINERADGLWIVLNEEYPQCGPAPDDPLRGDADAEIQPMND